MTNVSVISLTLSQPPCTALTEGLSAVRAVQGDCQWSLKNGRNSQQSHDPIMHPIWGVSESILASIHHTAGVVAVSLATISCQCIPYISSVGFPRNLCRIWVAGCRDADFMPSPQGWPVIGRKIRVHPVWGGRTQAVLRHICCPTGGFPCRG